MTRKSGKIFFIVLFFIFSWNFTVYTANAQKKVVILETMAVPTVQQHTASFLRHMRESRFAAVNEVELIYLSAEGNYQHGLELLKKEIARSQTDCVVTMATLASQAAKELLQGTDVPIVFGVVSDPVGAGIIAEVGKPSGTNITGLVYSLNREIQLSIMIKILGESRQLPVTLGVVQSDYRSTMDNLHILKELGEASGEFVIMDKMLSYQDMPENLDAMLLQVTAGVRELEDRVDFWWQLTGALTETPEFTETVLQNSEKPVAYGNTMNSVKQGALFTINPDFEASGKEIAERVIAILEGAQAGTISSTLPQSFEIGVNITTALKHGLVIPPDILDLAGENIFR